MWLINAQVIKNVVTGCLEVAIVANPLENGDVKYEFHLCMHILH